MLDLRRLGHTGVKLVSAVPHAAHVQRNDDTSGSIGATAATRTPTALSAS